MKNVITLILVCFLFANCKSGGGDGGASSGSSANTNFIPDNINDIGALAKTIIESNDYLNERYNSPIDPQTGEKIYQDAEVFRAIKAFVNATAKMEDGNGVYDIENNTPLDAYNDVMVNAGPSTQGLSNRGMCIFMADVLEALTIPTRLIEVSGAAHTVLPSGNHCMIEVSLGGEIRVIDPVFNVSYFPGPDVAPGHPLYTQAGPLDAEGVDATVDYYRNVNSSSGILTVSHDGHQNAVLGWRDTVDYDTYYHHYQEMMGNPTAQFLPSRALEIFDSIYSGVSFTDYSSLNR